MWFSRLGITLLILGVLGPAPAAARPLNLRQLFKPGARVASNKTPLGQRAATIHAGVLVHRRLLRAGKKVKLPASQILANKVAASKKYADSWTCRESTRLLLKKLTGAPVKLSLESSGKGTFDWGAEGKVSYHYYAVDNPAHPALLLDPTAGSNFSVDARPGGLLHGLLREAGKNLKQPQAAQRVARRIAGGGIDGLLVLANQADISVYRHALEAAARIKTGGASRDVERR